MSKRKRSISDFEISLVKAMIEAKFEKQKIQAYFTNPDRPVNFGRIADIESGKYGGSIRKASQQELQEFLASWEKPQAMHVAREIGSPVEKSRLQKLFERKGRDWFVKLGETEEVECKNSFQLSGNGKLFRAVAAMANNRGGHILFGVKNEELEVVGLKDRRFVETDPNAFSQVLRSVMEPLPRFEVGYIDLEEKLVGAIYVYKEVDMPVIGTKDEQNFREGTIYYRYPGESRAIRPAEYRKLLSARDNRIRQENVNAIQRVVELGDRAAVLDLESGKVEGASNSLLIDESLLSKIQFIRHGEFDEIAGAPALRLIGDVTATGSVGERIVRENIEEADVLRNFVLQEPVALPLHYVLRSLTTPKKWLPIFYYIQRSGKTVEEIEADIEARDGAYVASKRQLLERVKDIRKPFTPPTSRIKSVLDEIVSGKYQKPKSGAEAVRVAMALTGLPSASLELAKIMQILRDTIEVTRADKSAKVAMWSYIYKAAAQIDYLYFRPKS
jgi:hypothetical protein